MGSPETFVETSTQWGKMTSKMAPIFVFLCVLISSCFASPSQEVGEARANGDINLSELLNSDLAGPFATIAFLLFIDLFLMISYFGAKQNSRRKGHPKKRHHYRRHHGVRHHNRPYYHVGRMGDFGYGDESELQSLDWVDSTFGLINVDSEVCRERAVCELERAASENAFLGFIVKNLNSYVNGLDKYESAIERGLNGQSCEEFYAECSYSIGQSLPNLFKRR